MIRYKVGALVTGMIYDIIEAENEEQAKEIMMQKHGDESITLCSRCSHLVSGLAVSENTEDYETEELAHII